ncbi:facilitated trehalose transporter Tret1-like [Lycorma delicatula]|uniref:facilitated trehalose transporter Tret1-like n=1 Tax=Lycorma delicatula TaxID=130591 RepID=UPI003F5116A5
MPSHGIGRQYLAAFLASLPVLMTGAAYGWTSPTMLIWEEDKNKEFNMSDDQLSWVVSLIEIGNLITPVPCGFLVDVWGRKNMLLFTAPMWFISWLLIIFSKNFIVLCISRIIQGMAVGVVCTVNPPYLGEIAEKEIRGSISTFFQGMLYLGILLQYCIGPYVSYLTLAIFNAVIPILFLVTFIFMPESPYYLMMKDREAQAAKALMWLHKEQTQMNIKDDLKEIKDSVEEDMSQKATWWDLVATPSSRKAFFILQVAATTKFLSGYLGVLSYAQKTFSSTEGSSLKSEHYAILLGLLLFLPMFITAALADRIGRRPLLLTSAIGCAFCEILAGLFYFAQTKIPNELKPYDWIAFVTIASYFVLFSIGLGPLVSTLRAELFPSNTRGIASGVTNITETITCFISLKMYHIVAVNWGYYLDYWIFAVFCIIGAIIIYFTVPETKGKSFAQIQKQFSEVKQKEDDLPLEKLPINKPQIA